MEKIWGKHIDVNILERVIDSSYDGLTYTDENGIIVFSNKAYAEITGIDVADINGKSIYDLEPQGFPVSNMALEVFKTRKVLSKVIQYKKSKKEILVTIAPVYDEENSFKGILGNVRDLTSLNELRNELSLVTAKYTLEKIKHDEINRELELQRRKNLALKEKINALMGNLDNDMELLVNSKYSMKLTELAYRISNVDSTILITGESGVGKDVFCRLIHKFYNKNKPYIKISCGAIPENLMESELFGYEPGSFTGASKHGKKGVFETAQDGIVFLDEVGELTPALQVKLLTVLQDRKFYRIGGTNEIKVNAKIISATNRNLKEDVAEGLFRRDLYYRLNVIPVYIPPLRERREDIIPLANSYLDKLNKKNNTNVRVKFDVQKILEKYDWPGNIRELNNVVERMYVFNIDNEITLDNLPEELKPQGDARIDIDKGRNLKDTMDELESRIILKNLDLDLTLAEIANNLGINISTLQRKIEKYDLPRRYRKNIRNDML